MFKVGFKVLILFFKALSFNKSNNNSSPLSQAGEELLYKKSFRIPDDQYIGESFVLLKYYFRLVKYITLSKKNVGIKRGKTSNLVLDSNHGGIPIRMNFLKYSLKDFTEFDCAIWTKDKAFENQNLIQKSILILYSTILFFYLLIKGFSNINKASLGLAIWEFAENVSLAQTLKVTKAKNVYFFGVAEKDANFSWHVIKKIIPAAIVYKFPSPGALIAHNRKLQTDILCLSSKYQEEEFELLTSKSILCSEVQRWPSEKEFEYAHLYKNSNVKADYLLGFYSHGGWLRAKKGNTTALFGRPETEEICLQIVQQLCEKLKTTILIFLHPKEKKDFTATQNYYRNLFGNCPFEFYMDGETSTMSFHLVHIGISSYSAILFERDNMNKRVLVLRTEKFPLEGTTMFKNSFADVDELTRKVSDEMNELKDN